MLISCDPTETREDLKGQNLSFTVIAKLVGEQWQALPASEKEAFESRAAKAKEKFNRDLTDYKRTSNFKQYEQYLREFKQKQSKLSQGSWD